MGTLRRAALALALIVLTASRASAQRREPVWPMASGAHDVLHSFQNPFAFGGQYFHEGVDLRHGPDGRVLAMRSGIVRYRNQNDAGGTLRVEVQTPHGVESDAYVHVRLGAWQPGDSIQAGEVVGLVSTTYFFQELQDHVHLNRFRGVVSASGYVPGRTNMLHPLAIFPAPAERDPLELAPRPTDANEDGWTFRVVRHGNPELVLAQAAGAVELLLEAVDRQSDTLYFAQGLVGLGYWIESLAGGEHVASAEKPYRLVRFDDAWRASHADCDQLVRLALLTPPQYEVEFGPHNTGWRMLATYRLTRAAGFRGRGDEISPSQNWLTSARKGTGAPNGTGGLPARHPAEARFPDGLYRVHVLTEDLVHTLDTVFEVVVDNFTPTVRSLEVRSVGPRAATLDGVRVRLELELSEPMAALTTVALAPALGELSPWRSSEPVGQRRRFEAEWLVSGSPTDLESARLTLVGSDLAGNELTAELRPFAEPGASARR